ncbi:hypothetical protein CEUSTIGMA_g13431.t1 [Chlamydomonas eustigma]|uniref:Uncharacterized protein n=1 Tax=Chlamydomonas eustigma TaxID=1157962 RepID=A0A250XSK3_9CHLO|nr:hypothetical protein CEUSTIGMA_g13431.t1 [Chlamydomonas eustigma]|eukprot:GAX86016.1 hypothetical protein CEUSTIGMA_g13431.t1 [Chlamydomonas eustigma]
MNIFGDARSSRLGTRSRALCAQVYAVQAPPRRGSNPPSGTLPLVTPNAVILEERTSTGSRSSSTVVTPSSTTTNAANIPSLRPPNGRGPSTSTSASTTAASSALSVVSRFSGPSPSNRAFMDADVGRERPEEVDYKWAQDSYSSLQRTVDTWTFFTVFRSQLYLLDKKWSYLGGFSEDKKKDRTRSLARYLLESVLNLGTYKIILGGSACSKHC